jgi:hypothetical protein
MVQNEKGREGGKPKAKGGGMGMGIGTWRSGGGDVMIFDWSIGQK